MGEPDSRGQSVLRRSPRLLAKPATTTSKRTRLAAPRKPSRHGRKPLSMPFFDFGDCPITFRSILDIRSLNRSTRQANAQHFWIAYSHVYDTIPDGSLNIKERKHILVSNRKITQENDESHGMMWVAVHGMDYICAVFRNKAPDMKGILNSLGRGAIMTYFGKHILSDMENLADDSEMIGKKPFAVVSLTRKADNVVDENYYKASGDELDEEKAIEFLMRKMDRKYALTKNETIKTAIAGFHYLFKEKLKPEEIWVTFFHESGNDYFFEDLDEPKIKRYLDDIDSRRQSPFEEMTKMQE